MRAFVLRVLRASGYNVLEARNGEEAARVSADHPGAIHLLVTDVVLAGTSGPRVAEGLTASRPKLEVLFVSGYTPDGLLDRGMPGKGGRVLEKPLSAGTLARTMRELLDGPDPA